MMELVMRSSLPRSRTKADFADATSLLSVA